VNRFVDAVRARATGQRVPLTMLWEAYAETEPIDATATDRRQRLADVLDAAQRAGAWTAAKKTDRAGRPPLPAFVTLTAPDRHVRPDPGAVGWRPELGWAAALQRATARHLELLTAVNTFLRDGGSERPVVPAEERSLELFGDEKVISGRVGGATLWGPGRLTHALLRCVPSSTPFAYEGVGDGDRLLVVENQATFATVRDLLRQADGHQYAAVVFGAGRNAASTIGYLTQLPFPVAGVDYFGDLDVDGLEAAAACLHAARRCEVDAQVHRPLWELLLVQPPTSAATTPGHDRTVKAAAVLPAPLRPAALDVLGSGQRIAQERCGYELLSQTDGWWHNPTVTLTHGPA
jgi:hypothetical protein